MKNRKVFEQIRELNTEKRNPDSQNVDMMNTEEILNLINNEDKKVALAVEKEIDNIIIAVDKIVEAFKAGGRLLYLGAGTSGRLGVVDASECPPTFGSDPELVQGLIAGGKEAMFQAQEGAEDSKEQAANDLRNIGISNKDIVCGIAASGRTPYVAGAIEEAKRIGAYTIFISTVPKEQVLKYGTEADCHICPVVGPEVVTGSTRMKSGTAQKLVLNMLTTTAMIKMGKTMENVMIDLQLTNEKLKERAKKIIMEFCELEYEEAESLLLDAKGHVKSALLMNIAGIDYEEAQYYLEKSGGFVRKAIKMAIEKTQ